MIRLCGRRNEMLKVAGSCLQLSVVLQTQPQPEDLPTEG